MPRYNFYLEYRNTPYPQTYEKPDTSIRARTFHEALNRFGRNKRLRFGGWEPLNIGYRAYYRTRKAEYVYFVEEDMND